MHYTEDMDTTTQTREAELTIGWTKNTEETLAAGYVSFSDGYRPGAEQVEVAMTLAVPFDATMDDIAEAAFIATNSPFVAEGTLPYFIAEAIDKADYHGQGAHYSLSVGDTVTVDGVTLECAGMGWREVKVATCRHCDRRIEFSHDEGWVDPEAGFTRDDVEQGDGVWRLTCDAHDTFVAEHEPTEDASRERGLIARETES
jgi:hypothetical protein